MGGETGTDIQFDRLSGKPLALMGGSFDPFHSAHRSLAACAVSEFPVEALILMPLGRAPHKHTRMRFSTFRYEMAARGAEDIPRVIVSDVEIRTPGIDYTLDTISFLKARCAPDPLYLVVGSDALETMTTWYRYDALLNSVVLAVACRGGDTMDHLFGRADALRKTNGARIVFFDMPRSSLSSSALRERLLRGEPVHDGCPESVAGLIEKYRIYDFQKEFSALSDDAWSRVLDVEEAVWSFYSGERRLHAASVAQYGARLALLSGMDPEKALIAGFVHDAAKQLPSGRQRALAKQYLTGHPYVRRASRLLESCADHGAFSDHRTGNRWFRSLSESMLHGPASAELARRAFGVRDREILDAVCFHSTARTEMTPLEKIIYLADKISYDRNFKRLDPIRKCAENGDLDGAMRLCLNETFLALSRDALCPHPFSLAASRAFTEDADRPKCV